jgi:putative transposase
MLPTRLRRLRTFDYTGTRAYSLTLCTYERRPVFEDEPLVNVVIAQILRAARVCAFAIDAYCAMPDHAHLLVEGTSERSALVPFVHRAKQLSGYHGKALGGVRIWQTGYHDRIVGMDEDRRAVIAYIVENPVRRGLVTSPEDYPFAGSTVRSREELFRLVHAFRRTIEQPGGTAPIRPPFAPR